MTLSERVLCALSRDLSAVQQLRTERAREPEDPLSVLYQEYENFPDLVSNKKVADFGCGFGFQSVALAEKLNCTVTGIDTDVESLQTGINLAAEKKISPQDLSFIGEVSDEHLGKFDLVISQNSMEHFPDPILITKLLKSLIHKDGKVLITFGPPWYAPHGSHMDFFSKVPWVNILFSEKTVMNVRNLYRNDGATRYEEVSFGLNKMSISKFKKIIHTCGMQINFYKATGVKNLNLLTRIPIIKELVTNHVTVILSHKT